MVIDRRWGGYMPRPRKPESPCRYFNSSPEVIRLVVLMDVRFPLRLRNVKDLLFECGIDTCHEDPASIPCPRSNVRSRRRAITGGSPDLQQ
jgi:putative transposase